MKSLDRIPSHRVFLIVLALLGASVLTQTTHAGGDISFYGYEINQPRWRSTKVPKTIQLAGGATATDSDRIYGTLGWFLPALGDVVGLPDFIVLQDLKAEGTQTFQSPTYSGDVDDPFATPAEDVDLIPENLKGIAYQTPGSGKEAILLSIPLTGTVPPDFLVGIAFGNLAHPQEDVFGTGAFRASINDGPGTPPLPAIGNDSVIDWIFFRVQNAVPGDTIHIHGTGGAHGMTSIAIVAFDPLP